MDTKAFKAWVASLPDESIVEVKRGDYSPRFEPLQKDDIRAVCVPPHTEVEVEP